jgi:ankyrin repeat protein
MDRATVCNCSTSTSLAIANNCQVCFRREVARYDVMSTDAFNILCEATRHDGGLYLNILLEEFRYNPDLLDSDEAVSILWFYAEDSDQFPRENIERLLRAGADPNENGNGFTPLQWAVINGSSEVVNLFLQHGADPRLECDNGRGKDVDCFELARLYESVRVLKVLETYEDPFDVKNPGDD